MSRSRRTSVVWRRVRRSLVLAGAVLVGGATVAALTGPSAVAGAASSTTAPSVVLTVPTAGHHAYRHGAVPRKTTDVAGVRALVSTPAVPGAAAQSARASTRKALRYGGGLTAGGLSGAGVTVGQPNVYLVFMGSQWGIQSTSGGHQVFSLDHDAMAPALQVLYGGLGTGGETWSGILTQYCDGAPVNAIACVQGDSQVPYPTGGVLSGIWYDNSPSATSQEAAGLTGHQLAAEAEVAATYFGNTDQASNRNAQYVIVSPTGTDPDGWASQVNGYCAYHDDTNDSSIDGGGPVAGPIVDFTNLPYVPDAAASCGAGTVNSPGVLDGATEAASHEYAETMTDQFPESTPPGGWTDNSGQENGDKCAYLSTGPGAMFNLTLATGSVTVQGTWSNRADACADGEATFTYSPSITSFSPATAAAGSSVTITGVSLSDVTTVSFAGTPGAITADTTTSVTATVPAGAADGTLAVTTPFGSATSTKLFHLAPSIASYGPNPVALGGTLTITGSGLGVAKKVTIGGKKAAISSESATQILVTAPTKAVVGLIVVTSKYGTATSTTVLTVN